MISVCFHVFFVGFDDLLLQVHISDDFRLDEYVALCVDHGWPGISQVFVRPRGLANT